MIKSLWWKGFLAGSALLALFQALAAAQSTAPFIGGFVYNWYFLSLLEGRLDLPAQIVGLEGFYDAEGQAYIYHGLGPLVTRVLAWPFVDLTVTDLRPVSIWLFATIGSGAFYATILSIFNKTLNAWPAGLGGLVWVLVWVLAPGLVLAANGSFFHEPLGFAFAAAGLGIWCLWRLIEGGFTGWGWLVGLALAAALAVHGRPHVAVGLYAVTGAAGLGMLWRLRARALLPGALATLLLLASGLGYMQMNALRFGSAVETTGTVSDDAARTSYGFLFWGWEPPDHPRFKSQETHGNFVPPRILPNLFLYGVSMGGDASVDLFRRMTAEMGHIRIEPPIFGFLMLWLPWCILAGAAAVRRGGPGAFLWLGLLATLPAALVTLAYTTVTMRYRLELWPVLFVLGTVGLAGLLGRTGDPSRLMRSLWIAALAATGVSLFNAYIYSDTLNWDWATAMRSWEDCANMVSAHPGLGPEKVETICVLDVPGTG